MMRWLNSVLFPSPLAYWFGAIFVWLLVPAPAYGQATYVDSITGFSGPKSVSVDTSAQRLFVVDSSSQVRVYNFTNTQVNQFTGPSGAPNASVAASEGTLYLSNFAGANFHRMNYAGGTLASYGNFPAFHVASSGTNFVAAGFNLVTYGGANGSTGSFNPGIGTINGVALDRSLNVYTVGDGIVRRSTLTGGSQTTLISGLNPGSGIAVSGTDRIYVTNVNSVRRYNSAGTLETTFGVTGSGSGQFSSPFGITVATNGLIYVADSGNNRVQRWFSPTEWTTAYNHTFSDVTLQESFTLDAGKSLSFATATIASGTTVAVAGGTLTGGTLTLNGTLAAGGLNQSFGGLTGTGTVNLATNSVLTVGENNASSTFSGTTAGNGSLTKVGTGTLTLSGVLGHTGNTIVQAGTLDFAPASGTQTVVSPISGGGNVSKSGAGTTVLSGNNAYTGTTTVNNGILRAGSNTAFGSNSAVTLANTAGTRIDLNGFAVSVGSLSSGGTTGGRVDLNGGTLTVGGDNTSTTFAGGFGNTTGNLVKVGSGQLTLTGTNGYTGTTTVSGGGLRVDSALAAGGGAVIVGPGAVLSAFASIDRQISGVGSTSGLTTGADNISLGNASVANGFVHQGTFAVANNVTLNSAGFAQLGVSTVLFGVTLSAPNGVALGSGSTLSGSGTVNAKVAGSTGSQINATFGNLSLGANVVGGFVHHGELSTGANTVTILSTNRATLGSVTTLGSGGNPGTLTVANGAVVDFGRAIQGHGTVSSTNTLARAMIVNGDVYGTSPTERVTFTGYVKGVGTFSNTTFDGTFSPGLSPTISNTTNAAFGANATLEMELGGTVPGSQHDKLIDGGHLMLNGTLKVVFLAGYTPTGTETYDILDWQTASGTFHTLDFSQAAAPLGYEWNTSSLYTHGTLSFTPVPEPASILTVCGLAVGGGVLWRRWRRK